MNRTLLRPFRMKAIPAALSLVTFAVGPAMAQEPPRPPEVSAFWNDRITWGRGDTKHQKNSYRFLQLVSEAGQSNYARIVQEARAYVLEGRFDKAIPLFEQATRVEPQDAPYDELGDALASVNRLQEAVAAYRILIYGGKAAEKDKSSIAQSGENVTVAGAMSVVRKPLDWRGNSPATLMRYFLLLLRVGEDDEAFEVYQWGIAGIYRDEAKEVFAIRLNPKTWKAKKPLLMASAHTIIGKTEHTARTPDRPELAALARYREALAIQPDYAPALLYMGQIYRYFGEYENDETYTKSGRQMLEAARRSDSPAVRQIAKEWLGPKLPSLGRY